MKLIVRNTDELRTLTGFTDADIEYEKLKTSLEIATDELCKIIGKPTYIAILKYYEDVVDEDANPNEFQVLKKAQICVAFRGIAIYAPLNDLAFTNQGRQMRVDEHHKSAFEWMIDRSDSSLEKIYYKSLDGLIETLDEINPLITLPDVKWKDSDAYKNSFDGFFRTTEEFNEYFNIDSRYLLMKLIPGVKKIQLEEIIPRVGESIFEEYQTALRNGAAVPNIKVLSAMKSACAYLALSWGIKRMSATLFPQGVLQSYVAERTTTQPKKVPEKEEVGIVALCFQRDGEKALLNLEELVNPKPEPVYGETFTPEINSCPNQKFISL